MEGSKGERIPTGVRKEKGGKRRGADIKSIFQKNLRRNIKLTVGKAAQNKHA